MSKRASLRQYQNELQEQMERARLAGTHESILYVAFVAGGDRYLLDARHVLEAVDPSALVLIPGAKPWAVGVANIRGEAFAVTDVSVLCGGAPIAKGKFLTLDDGLLPGAALRVERLLGLVGDEQVGQIQSVDDDKRPHWVLGSLLIGGQSYFLIGGDELAADPKFSILQSGEHHDESQG